MESKELEMAIMNKLELGFDPVKGDVSPEAPMGDESDEYNEHDEEDESTTSSDSSSTRIDENRWLKLAGLLKD